MRSGEAIIRSLTRLDLKETCEFSNLTTSMEVDPYGDYVNFYDLENALPANSVVLTREEYLHLKEGPRP